MHHLTMSALKHSSCLLLTSLSCCTAPISLFMSCLLWIGIGIEMPDSLYARLVPEGDISKHSSRILLSLREHEVLGSPRAKLMLRIAPLNAAEDYCTRMLIPIFANQRRNTHKEKAPNMVGFSVSKLSIFSLSACRGTGAVLSGKRCNRVSAHNVASSTKRIVTQRQ